MLPSKNRKPKTLYHHLSSFVVTSIRKSSTKDSLLEDLLDDMKQELSSKTLTNVEKIKLIEILKNASIEERNKMLDVFANLITKQTAINLNQMMPVGGETSFDAPEESGEDLSETEVLAALSLMKQMQAGKTKPTVITSEGEADA